MKGTPALDVCAVVGPGWLAVERRGLACVAGSLVLRLARPDAGYDVVAARQMEGLDIRPWPASLASGFRGRKHLVWEFGGVVHTEGLLRAPKN